jgi:hypothetical protein
VSSSNKSSATAANIFVRRFVMGPSAHSVAVGYQQRS